MKVLVIGKGGREHALLWRLNQSETARKLYCAGGNPGIAQLAKIIPVAQNDFAGLADFVRKETIDLTVVGPEDPLAAGIVDEFDRAGLRIFGPTKAAAQLEASKAFAKAVMREAGVPTASFEVFDEAEAARRWVRARGGPMVVKADGLALGKGVVVCEDAAAALTAIDDAMERRRFGAAGARIVIEERLKGEELSFFALCDGENAIALGLVQDHKAAFDGDRGRINVLEYNVRFGDPECEPLMMRFEGDLAEMLLACTEGRLNSVSVRLSPRAAVAVVLASGGYPGEHRRGVAISGLERIDGAEPSDAKVRWALQKTRVKVFHAGTAMQEGRLVSDGGRVLVVTAMATDLSRAVGAAYEAAAMIEFEGLQMRRDIARRALDRLAQ